jgi:excisionase family DNA binding protein
MNKLPQGYYRVKEAAAHTHTAPRTIYEWIRMDRVSAIRFGGLLHVHLADVAKARQRSRISRHIPNPPPAGLITTHQAGTTTGISTRTIAHWAATGQIEAQRHGPKMWYVSLEDVKHLAETTKAQPR